eukprot:s234_g25.t1
MPVEPEFLHALDGLLSWWTHHEAPEDCSHHVHASGVEHAPTEVPMHHDFSSFLQRPAHPVQGSFLWTTEQLMQRRQQLRAVGVESSVIASGTGLFVAKLMRILRRIQAEEDCKTIGMIRCRLFSYLFDYIGPVSFNYYRTVKRKLPAMKKRRHHRQLGMCSSISILCRKDGRVLTSLTDAELYAYLAQRSNDPGMAELAELADSPQIKLEPLSHAAQTLRQATQAPGQGQERPAENAVLRALLDLQKEKTQLNKADPYLGKLTGSGRRGGKRWRLVSLGFFPVGQPLVDPKKEGS